MLRPQLQYRRDGTRRRIIFGLLRPNDSRKVYIEAAVHRDKWGGHGERGFTFGFHVFDD